MTSVIFSEPYSITEGLKTNLKNFLTLWTVGLQCNLPNEMKGDSSCESFENWLRQITEKHIVGSIYSLSQDALDKIIGYLWLFDVELCANISSAI